MTRRLSTFPTQTTGKGASSRGVQPMLAAALRHHRAGRTAEAEQIYRQILAVHPNHADSLHLLGMAAYQAGRCEAAIALIRRAIAVNKSEAAYHLNLGTVFHSQNNLCQASRCYEQALGLNPQLAKAHYNLGNVLHTQERLEAAETCYRRALAIEPNLAEAHYNLGNVVYEQGRVDEAVASYERSLSLDPEKQEARHNLGNALQAQGRSDEARVCYEQVLKAWPDYAKAHVSLGGVLHAAGDVDAALACYQRALVLQPDLAEAAFSQALAQLLRGEFGLGWQNYERRWQTKEHAPPMRRYLQPLWEGESLQSGRLLVWGEQGIGDEIMFAGLIPDTLRPAPRCVLECDLRLKALFGRSFPGVEVVARGADSAVDFVAHLPSGSLPRLFRARREAFQATTSPYLIADPSQRERFRSAYGGGRRLIGLSWYTNNGKTGRIRSIDLSSLAPLFARPDIRWISLQYGDHDELEDQAAAVAAPLFIDRSVDQLLDIDRFAAQVAAMDMVVTIDNSTAHLAGALGVPTLLLLPFAADWRWFEGREDSPWYPHLRLFRQPSRGDWQPVVERAARYL